jgi:hypothetical protein
VWPGVEVIGIKPVSFATLAMTNNAVLLKQTVALPFCVRIYYPWITL